MSTSVLLVDDDERFRERLARALERRGLVVTSAENVRDAATAIATAPAFGYAVLDLKLPDGSGLELLGPLRNKSESTRIIVLTGYGSIATAVQAVKEGASEYLQKPVDAQQVWAALCGAEAAAATSPPPEPAAPSLARVEWEHLQRVLADCDGNISEAARRLGLHRRSLQRKLQKAPPRS